MLALHERSLQQVKAAKQLWYECKDLFESKTGRRLLPDPPPPIPNAIPPPERPTGCIIPVWPGYRPPEPQPTGPPVAPPALLRRSSTLTTAKLNNGSFTK
jgi:hypothetical protein